MEVETQWSFLDLFEAHEVLDMCEKAEQEAYRK